MFDKYFSKQYSWKDPLEVAKQIVPNKEDCTFLYSSLNNDLGKYSYLCYDILKKIEGQDFLDITKIDNEQWFGYLGYGLKNSIEDLPFDEEFYIDLPNFCLVKYKNIIRFDHVRKLIDVFYKEKFDDSVFELDNKSFKSYKKDRALNIYSNMSKQQYLESVNTIKSFIKEGIVYQANLTRKFYGTFEKIPDYLDLFIRLCNVSPSPYSCLIKVGGIQILSSSPEQFLKIDENNNVEAMPIKGTIKRRLNVLDDYKQIEILKNSIKDKSENLMIVDLMRNDFAKNCSIGSIQVPELFEILTFSTLHHMYSKIIGRIKDGVSNLEFIKGCFPPGSMTGAPKIKSMEVCSALEKYKRGVYSGCIGRLSKNGSADLSVVIRTLLIESNKFEFQVGGAIVYDSDPIKEWEETVVKAKAISKILGVNMKTLKGI